LDIQNNYVEHSSLLLEMLKQFAALPKMFKCSI